MTDPTLSKDLLDLVAALDRQRPPVIITFGEFDEVVDTSGDLRYYADHEDALIQMLTDLLVGWQEGVDSLAEVQMPSGRHADVRIVPEGLMRHVILFDVSAKALEQREVLQSSHTLAMTEQRRRIELERQLGLCGGEPGADRLADAERHRLHVVEMLSWDIRARLDEIHGHAQILDEGVAKPSAEAHSIAAIKRASMHLQGLAWACLSCLQESFAQESMEEPLDIKHLVTELETQFGSGPQLQRVSFETDYRLGSSHLVSVDYTSVYQILVGLVTCVLDATDEALSVKVFIEQGHLVVEILAGPAVGQPGEAVPDLSHDLRYVAAHHCVGLLGGRLIRQRGIGGQIRLELPLIADDRASPRNEGPLHPLSTTVLVAIDDPRLRGRVLSELSFLGLSAHTCQALGELESVANDPDIAMIILGGEFAGATGIGMSYRLHAAGIRRRMLLLRPVAGLGSNAWVFDGRRTIISSDADADVLRAAIEGALRT